MKKINILEKLYFKKRRYSLFCRVVGSPIKNLFLNQKFTSLSHSTRYNKYRPPLSYSVILTRLTNSGIVYLKGREISFQKSFPETVEKKHKH